MNISNNQLIHRQYLQSQIWADIRHKALIIYGSICNRCGEYGTDVHHKTYERVGGFELMTDLEVLCRDCHIVHHKSEKCTKSNNLPYRGINQQTIFRVLSPKQKQKLIKIYNLKSENELYISISFDTNIKLIYNALQFIGYDYFYKQRYKYPKSDRARNEYIKYTQFRQ